MRRSVCLSGFTLLELVLAAGMVALVSTAAVVFLGRGLTAWQRGDGRLQQLFEVEKGLEGLGEDLRNSLSLASRPFDGTASALGFARAEDATDLEWVSYQLAGGAGGQTLIRERASFPEEAGEVPQRKSVLHGLVGFSVEYGALEEAGGQRTLQWVGSWSGSGQPAQVPRLIRVMVRVDDPKGGIHSVTREFWIPHGVLASPPASS